MASRISTVFIFVILTASPLLAQRGSVKLVQPREKLTVTSSPDFKIEVLIKGISNHKKISLLHNDKPVKYTFGKTSGRLTSNLLLQRGNNLIIIKVRKKTHRLLIQYKPEKKPTVAPSQSGSPKITLGKNKTIDSRPKSENNQTPQTIDDLQAEVERFTTSKTEFPIVGNIEGINSRKQLLIAHNKKEVKKYSFKNGALKCRIRLVEGVNEIVLAAENEEGVDVARWEITYVPEGNESAAEQDEEYILRDGIINVAKKYIGTPYIYGGTSPRGFDCSGFTLYVLEKYGIKLPRVSGDQARVGRKIRQKHAKSGDLVFFAQKGRKVSHVSIVMESDADKLLVVHSTSSKGVMIQDVMKSSYWRSRMLYIRDVISK